MFGIGHWELLAILVAGAPFLLGGVIWMVVTRKPK